MLANTPNSNKDPKKPFEQDIENMATICKEQLKILWGKAWELGDTQLAAKYSAINNDNYSIIKAIEDARDQALEEKIHIISNIYINGLEININYELEETLTGTSSTPLSFFSRSSSPRSPTPKGMFRTISGIGNCFGSQRSSTNTSPSDFNLNSGPKP